MCRNIRVLHNFQPPTTPEEIRDAALQFVRKVSGIHKPSQLDAAVFEQAIEDISESTERLLHSLTRRGQVRTRELEREKAAARWQARSLPVRERKAEAQQGREK